MRTILGGRRICRTVGFGKFCYSTALCAHGTLLLGDEIVPYERPSPFVMRGTPLVGGGPHCPLTTRFPLCHIRQFGAASYHRPFWTTAGQKISSISAIFLSATLCSWEETRHRRTEEDMLGDSGHDREGRLHGPVRGGRSAAGGDDKESLRDRRDFTSKQLSFCHNPLLKHRGGRTCLAPSILLRYSLIVSAAPKADPERDLHTRMFHVCRSLMLIAPPGKATG